MKIPIELTSMAALVVGPLFHSVIGVPNVSRAHDELHAVCAAWYIPVPNMAGLKRRQHHAQPSVPQMRRTLAAVEKVPQRDRMSA